MSENNNIPFDDYKSIGNLKAIMHELGIGVNKKTSPDVCPFHNDNKDHPGFNWFTDRMGFGRWQCMSGCGGGDIYDLVEMGFGVKGRAEQFDWVSRKFGGPGLPGLGARKEISGPTLKSWKPSPPRERKRDLNAELGVQKLLEDHHLRETMVKKYLEDRGFSDGPTKDFIASRMYYWPGYEEAEKHLGNQKLYAAGIPGRRKGAPSNWERHGVVVKMDVGWKLRFKDDDGKWIKMASLGGKYWPIKEIPRKPILVEGDIDRLAMESIGISGVLVCGSTSMPEIQLIEIIETNPEGIMVIMDGDTPGLKSGGFIQGKDGTNKNSLPGKIRALGYKGMLKSCRIPGEEDPAGIVKTGGRDGFIKIVKGALDFDDIVPEPDPDKPDPDKINIPVYDGNTEDVDVGSEVVTPQDWTGENGSLLWPFRFLGVRDNSHYFISRSQEVFCVPSKSITANSFLTIAPLEFWQSIKVGSTGVPDWTFLTNLILEHSIAHGAYRSENIRGTGIWEDSGEIVFSDGNMVHSKTRGDHLVSKFPSKDNIFVMSEDMHLVEGQQEEAQQKEDHDFIRWVTEVLSFKTPEHGKLLFGWIVSSFFLSVLSWRPIAYMKGSSGVGKSWVMNNIVRPLLEGVSINPRKSSTAVGIMQAQGFSSRMTTVDELESSTDKKTMELVKNLMTIARDSTTNGAHEKRYTGTADQTGVGREFSSMFLFASIVESATEDQDVNRITGIEFEKKYGQKESWIEISGRVKKMFDSGLAMRIRGDILYHRETIYKNIKTFEIAASGLLNTQRNADQLGTLIGGWYYFENPGHEATIEEASELIKQFDLSEQEARSEGNTMKTIMGSILSYKVRYEEEEIIEEYGGSRGMRLKQRTRSVYEILVDIKKRQSDYGTNDPLNRELMAYGLKFGHTRYPDKLIVACNHEDIKKMLPPDFPYKANYKDYLKDHPACVDKMKSVKFSGTVYSALVFDMDLNEEDVGEYTDNVLF